MLTAAFPGDMSIRPTQAVVCEALDQRRSVGWISQLRRRPVAEPGEVAPDRHQCVRATDRDAGRDLLSGTSHPAGGRSAQHDNPLGTGLLRSSSRYLGLALLMAQERGATIVGLVEDMHASILSRSSWWIWPMSPCKRTPGTCSGMVAGQDVPGEGGLPGHEQVLKLEKRLSKAWDDALFEHHYLPAVAQEDHAIASTMPLLSGSAICMTPSNW